MGRTKKAGERGKKKVGDSLGSWGRTKIAGERGKKRGIFSVVGSKRKRRASEEKKGETVSVVGGD